MIGNNSRGFIQLLVCMINIKIKGPNSTQGTTNIAEVEYPIIKPRLWIGRGEDVLEKEGLQSYALNLAAYSKAVSRIHACVLFSPAFFAKEQVELPRYLRKLRRGWEALSQETLIMIWEFARPAKRVLLKDLQSKAGIFRKLGSEPLFPGMTIVLGDSRPIIVHNREIYDSAFSLAMRLQQLTQQGFTIINPEIEVSYLSFWTISYRSTNYILIHGPSQPVLIGRSSDCQIAIPEPAISRRHAILHFQKDEWVLSDGDGLQASSNGVWMKARRIWMNFQGKEERRQIVTQNESQKQGSRRGRESKCKVGDILLSFCIKEERSLMHIQECVSFNRSTDGSLHEIWKKQTEFEDLPELQKYHSQL